jgi:hypothetical protein
LKLHLWRALSTPRNFIQKITPHRTNKSTLPSMPNLGVNAYADGEYPDNVDGYVS